MLEGPKDQLILDNDEITEDVGDVGMAKDAKNVEKTKNMRDARKIKDIRDRKYIKDAGKLGNIGDIGNARDTGNKETRKNNNGGANERDQEDGEVGNVEISSGGHQKVSKLQGVKVNNNGVNDGKNLDNRCATVEDVADFDDGVTITVDLIDGVLANILVHSFSFCSP